MANTMNNIINSLNELEAINTESMDRPSYIQDPEEILKQNMIDQYRDKLPELMATKTRSEATIGPKETGPIEDFMGYIYSQPKAGPIIAALDDLTPGIPFYNIVPDPPDELPTGPEHGGNRGRTVAAGVDIALALASLPHALKKGVGRIATNIKRPKDYSLSSILEDAGYYNPDETLSGQGRLATIGKMAKAVITDRPTYTKPMMDTGTGGPSTESLLMREPLYRKQFGLKPRSLEELAPKGSLEGTKWENFTDANVYITNPDGTLRFNPESKIGQKALEAIADPVRVVGRHDHTYGTSYHPALGNYARTPLTKGSVYDPEVHRVNPYRNKFGKASLKDVRAEVQNLNLLKSLYGPDSNAYKSAQKRYAMQDADSALEEVDRIFYNDVWDFKLSTSETKYLKSHFDEIKEILTDSHFKKMGYDKKMPIKDRLILLKKYYTDPDMKEYHGEKIPLMMRSFMNKLIDHVEVKGTVKYKSGHPGSLKRNFTNVEDDKMWGELILGALK